MTGLRKRFDAAALESHVRIGPPASLTKAATRSYLRDGRCVGWVGPVPDGTQIAIDAELADLPVPPGLGHRLGVAGFWHRWTRAECAAKLSGVPMAMWIQRHGLDAPARFGYTTITAERLDPNLVVTVAWTPRALQSTQSEPSESTADRTRRSSERDRATRHQRHHGRGTLSPTLIARTADVFVGASFDE